MSYTSIRDMFDGGGQGASGDKWTGETNAGKILNLVGIKPLGATRSDTPVTRSYEEGAHNNPTGGDWNGETGGKNAREAERNLGWNSTGVDRATAEAQAKAAAPTAPAATPTDVKTLSEQAYKSGLDPSKVLDDPGAFLADNVSLSSQVPEIAATGNKTNLGRNNYTIDADGVAVDAVTGEAVTVDTVDPKEAVGYEADQVTDDVIEKGQSTAAQGELSNGSTMDAEQIDTVGAATGQNADGTTNKLGEALNAWASQDIAKIIDTSTVAGKLLAQELGEGNYTDAKATVAGQMKILSAQFIDGEGNPKIPSWAAGVARNVSKIAAFKGMTGTAATAAMSQAIMEASLPMAQQDAQFFQTVTMANLSNKQQMTVQKASVLANLELANLDARTQAAVTNAQAFLQMDLTNLSNEQQSEIVNTQARVQALLEDSSATNAARLFSSQSQNDFTKFYDQLNAQIEQYSASQLNEMSKFNVDQVNSVSQFNANIESQREQFYKEMQFNVDLANAKWRQTVVLEETAMKFQAAQQDVQNMFGLSAEAMTRMWDREDQNLNYAWNTSESALDRELENYLADRKLDLETRKQKADEDSAFGQGLFEAGKWLLGGLF